MTRPAYGMPHAEIVPYIREYLSHHTDPEPQATEPATAHPETDQHHELAREPDALPGSVTPLPKTYNDVDDPDELVQLIRQAAEQGWRPRYQWRHAYDRPASRLPVVLRRGTQVIKAVWLRQPTGEAEFSAADSSINVGDGLVDNASLAAITAAVQAPPRISGAATEPGVVDGVESSVTEDRSEAHDDLGAQAGDIDRASAPRSAATGEELDAQTIDAALRDPWLAQVAATNGRTRFAEAADTIVGDFINDYLYRRHEQAENDGERGTAELVLRFYNKYDNRLPELTARIVEQVWNRLPMAPRYPLEPAAASRLHTSTGLDRSPTTSAPTQRLNPGAEENSEPAQDTDSASDVGRGDDGHDDSGRNLDADRQARSLRVGVLEDQPAEIAERAAGSGDLLLHRGSEDSPADRGTDRSTAEQVLADRPDKNALGNARTGTRTRLRGEHLPAPGARNRGPAELAQPHPPAPTAELTARERAQRNLVALRTLRRLQNQKRPATAAEQDALGQWLGWGAVSGLFVDEPVREAYSSESQFKTADLTWRQLATERTQIRQLLTDKQWQAASDSIRTAYYTDPTLVQIMWTAVRALGFDGGEYYEPGCGSGKFIEAAPTTTSIPATAVGVEHEPISAAIAAYRFPDATIVAKGIEEYRVKTGRFALAIGNVPWVDVRPFSEDDNPKRKHSLHNLAIITATRAVAPGGIVALITTRHTLDNHEPASRAAIHRYGDLIGAIRLPASIHRATAGTDVVTDMLFLRRRDDSAEPTVDDGWLRSEEVVLPGHDQPQRVNSYFVAHPEQVVGDMHVAPARFGPELTVTAGADLDVIDAIWNAVGRITDPVVAIEDEVDEDAEPLADGTLDLDAAGNPTIIEDGASVTLNIHPDQRDQLVALIRIKNQTNELYAAETATKTAGETTELAARRTELREAFRAYRRAHPPVNKPGQHRIYTPKEARARAKRDGIRSVPEEWKVPTAFSYIEDDPTAALLFGLESYDQTTGKADEQQVLRGRILERRELPTHADTIEAAVAIALDTDGLLNIDRVANLLGVSKIEAAVKMEQAELAFRSPDSSGAWIPRHMYLSGNVRAKLVAARAAAEGNRVYQVNVVALEAVQPVDLDYRDIRLRVGAKWVPAEVYAEFLHELGFPDAMVKYAGGTVWEVRGAKGGVLATTTWGTSARSTQELFQALLTKTDSAIRVTYTTPAGTVYEDREATTAAREKARRLAHAFDGWVWKDPERRERLARIFNDKINCLVETRHPDTPLVLPGLASDWTMGPHQNSAIRRILAEPTLVEHPPGGGKTAIFTAAAMELRRTKLAGKPVIAVPKNRLKGWVNDFRRLYPNAKLLAINASDLGVRRAKFMARAAGGDWDAVIITHSALNRLPLRKKAQEDYIARELAGLRRQLTAAKGHKMDATTLRRVGNAIDTAESRLRQRIATQVDEAVSFEDLGIDYIFYDEPHEDIKNLLTPSAIPGAAIVGSARATKAHMLIDYVRRHSRTGRSVSFADATPITNSMAEAYVHARYLVPELLEEFEIDSFDAFVANYADVKTDLEPSPSGNGYVMKPRLAVFLNVPELLMMYRRFADVQTEEDLKLPLPHIRVGEDGQPGETIVIDAAEGQLNLIQSLMHEPWIKEQGGTLKALGIGLRISTDSRLAGGEAEDGSKLPSLIENLLTLYHETKDIVYPVSAKDLTPQPLPGALHGVFLNEGTPGSGAAYPVNLYEEIREQLVSGMDGRWEGIPREKIKFIHDAKTDAQKERLYAQLRNGEALVILGSDKKMGTGLNVQDRFYSVHHVSFSWTPDALAQALGRMKRQGNLNYPDVPGTPDEVRRFFYITAGTFDEFRLTNLRRKAFFIEQLKKRSFNLREIEDLGEDTITLSTLNGLASGDPAIQQRAQATAARGHYEGLARIHDEDSAKRSRLIGERERYLAKAVPAAELMRAAAQTRQPTSGKDFVMTIDGDAYRDRAEAGAALLARLAQITDTDLTDGPIALGVLGALPLHVESTSPGMVRLSFGWEVPGGDRCPWWYPESGAPTDGRELVMSLERVLSKLDRDLDDVEGYIASDTQELDSLAADPTSDENPFRPLARSKEREEAMLGDLIIANQDKAAVAAEVRRLEKAQQTTPPVKAPAAAPPASTPTTGSTQPATPTPEQQLQEKRGELNQLQAEIDRLHTAIADEHTLQQQAMITAGLISDTSTEPHQQSDSTPVEISAAAAGHGAAPAHTTTTAIVAAPPQLSVEPPAAIHAGL
ncbi:hypothetical protein [Nocardia suismassiliense]|uniref:hypothetical protein n=1 Tax=Nocardia suismassiliense TaxID=2077092 RepID=UPI000D1EB81A|nr:hypothetical protein [Nocardia suismassiliense]